MRQSYFARAADSERMRCSVSSQVPVWSIAASVNHRNRFWSRIGHGLVTTEQTRPNLCRSQVAQRPQSDRVQAKTPDLPSICADTVGTGSERVS